jgi:hypothetical protein
MTQDMKFGKLFVAFPIKMASSVKNRRKQRRNKYINLCSKLAALLKITDTKLAYLGECEAALCKDRYSGFDRVTKDEKFK